MSPSQSRSSTGKPSSDSEVHYAEQGLEELQRMVQKPHRKERPLRYQRAVSASSHFWKPTQAVEEKTVSPPVPSPEKPKLHKTAYLDGLRGFAAFLVFNLHNEIWAHSSSVVELGLLENTWGAEGHHWLVTFPGLRVFFSGGHLAVAVFFIISGYVLSAKPLSLIHAGERAKLADNLTSALFRRWVRLYLPVIATTFIWATSWHLFGIRSNAIGVDPPEKAYFDEIWKWYCDFKNFSYIFQNEPANKYNPHTWSIPAEFRGSIVVFTSVLAFSRCSHTKRLLGFAGLTWYFTYVADAWFCALFCMGMLLCDLDLLAARDEIPQLLARFKPRGTWLYYILLAVGLYVGGVQSLTNDIKYLRYQSPGWYWLSYLKPQAFWDHRWFFRFIGASCIMISVGKLNWLKSFFETKFCQYLGKISFCLYLVHGPILVTLGARFYAAAGRAQPNTAETIPSWVNYCRLPDYGPFGLELNFIVPYVLLLGFTLWTAEIATRLIDEPSVQFAAWLFREANDGGDSLKLPQHQVSEKKEKAYLA